MCAATISAQVRELPSPAGTGGGQPNLAVSPDGHVYLSWIERLGEWRFSLRFATLEKDGWSTPRVIAEGSNWFVNWADFPSMAALPDSSLAAHWLVKSGQGTFDYDVTISRPFDGWKTWGKPFVPHRDGSKAEHGFVSLFITDWSENLSRRLSCDATISSYAAIANFRRSWRKSMVPAKHEVAIRAVDIYRPAVSQPVLLLISF